MRRPSVEFYEAQIYRCRTCGAEYPAYAGEEPETCCHMEPLEATGTMAWWYWYVQPGCLPDSDPYGPFDSEADARDDLEDYLDYIDENEEEDGE